MIPAEAAAAAPDVDDDWSSARDRKQCRRASWATRRRPRRHCGSGTSGTRDYATSRTTLRRSTFYSQHQPHQSCGTAAVRSSLQVRWSSGATCSRQTDDHRWVQLNSSSLSESMWRQSLFHSRYTSNLFERSTSALQRVNKTKYHADGSLQNIPSIRERKKENNLKLRSRILLQIFIHSVSNMSCIWLNVVSYPKEQK